MSSTAKDFVGKELSVGDNVVFCRLKYRELAIGKIKRITEQMVFIDFKNMEIKQKHIQVVKLESN